jgi:hypothetical protein
VRSIKQLGLIAAAAMVAAGCQPAPNSNSASVNQNASAVTASPHASATAASPPVSTSELALATPTDAYKAAFQYRKNKDIEGLKRVFSKDVLEFLTELGKTEKTTLDDDLRKLTNEPQAATPETRNEKINGETAELEYRDAKGGWQTMDFVKEDGVWKMTIPAAKNP